MKTKSLFPMKQTSIRVNMETEQKIVYWSSKLGISRAQFCQLCIMAGMNSIINAVGLMEGKIEVKELPSDGEKVTEK